MADEKDSVLDMPAEEKKDVKAEKTETAPAPKASATVSMQFSTLIIIFGLVTIALNLLEMFIMAFAASAALSIVFLCLTFIPYIATLVIYFIDIIKNKAFAFNVPFVVVLLATLVMF